jgi:hypothetical protein
VAGDSVIARYGLAGAQIAVARGAMSRTKRTRLPMHLGPLPYVAELQQECLEFGFGDHEWRVAAGINGGSTNLARRNIGPVY